MAKRIIDARAFLDLQRKYEAVPIEHAINRLERNEYRVTEDNDGARYRVSKQWTEKGLRHYAALAELVDGLWVEAGDLEDAAEKKPDPKNDERTPDERFLDLVVLCGLKDRLDAMKIRQTKGVAAALEFLKETTLTPEHQDGANNGRTSFSKADENAFENALRELYAARAVTRVITEASTEDDKDSLSIAAEQALNRAVTLLEEVGP